MKPTTVSSGHVEVQRASPQATAWQLARRAVHLGADVAAATRRTAGFFEATFARRPVGGAEVPVPQPGPGVLLGAVVDEFLLTMFTQLRKPLPREEHVRIVDEADAALELYERRGWLADPAGFHVTPEPAEPSFSSGSVGPVRFEYATFVSHYAPDEDDPGRQRWLSYSANHTVHTWVLRRDPAAPWLVCVHGAGMGDPLADLMAFRAGHLHRRLGLNVAIPVLPRHGPRHRRFALSFPGDELLDNVHGAAQAAFDIRSLLAWARAQGGPVGLTGISLGGYVTALVADLEPELACAIAGNPVVDFTTLLSTHSPARYRTHPGFAEMLAASERVHRVVSPLAMPVALPPQRRFIYAGIGDRLVRPDQVQRLVEHWEGPTTLWYSGGHASFAASRRVRAFVDEALRASGLVAA
ncbi:MAG: alpha/beta hydrolase family protein [Acidimicrobiales bacterium]